MGDNRAGGTIGLITGLTILSAGAIASVLFARKLADRRAGGEHRAGRGPVSARDHGDVHRAARIASAACSKR